MKTVATFLIVILTVCVLPGTSPRAEQAKDEAGCAVIDQALRDYQQVKGASTRREVEKYFRRDGGFQFPAKSRYVYLKCDYLHVDVEFDLAKPAGMASAPEDKVIGISKIYVEYPATD